MHITWTSYRFIFILSHFNFSSPLTVSCCTSVTFHSFAPCAHCFNPLNLLPEMYIKKIRTYLVKYLRKHFFNHLFQRDNVSNYWFQSHFQMKLTHNVAGFTSPFNSLFVSFTCCSPLTCFFLPLSRHVVWCSGVFGRNRFLAARNDSNTTAE